MADIPVQRFDEYGRPIYEIDYPVLARFMMSTAKVQVIRGPVGSGKSKLSNLKLYSIASQQTPDRAGIRRTRWGVIRNCYDDQTEILTESRGFQLFRDLLPDDRVATLQGDDLIYVKPDGVSVSDYVGEMLGFEGEGVDFLVTPDHEMWVSECTTRKQVWGDFGMRYASEIFGKSRVRVRKDAVWHGVSKYTEDLFEVIGYWLAEGSCGVYGGHPRCVITTVNDIDYCRELLRRAGVSFVEHKRSRGVNFILNQSDEIVSHLVGRSHTKAIPQFVKDASPPHLLKFIEGFHHGDGHQRKDSVTKTMYTSSKQLADDLQEIAMKAGMAANITSRDRRGAAVKIGDAVGVVNHIEYTVTLLSKKKHRPILIKQKGRYRGWYKQQYAGKVYCAEMDIPVVFVRRNGRAFWCRRTYPELITTTMRTWRDTFPEEVYGRIVMSKPAFQRIKVGDIEMEIDFLALDKEEDVSKLRSLEYTGFYVNELQYVPKVLFDEMTSRAGRYPAMKDGGPTWYGVIADMNAPDEDHFIPMMTGEVEWPEHMALDDRLALAWPHDWDYFMQPPGMLEVYGADGKTIEGYRDNPDAENVKWLPPGYYREQIKGKTRAWIKSRVLNKIALVIDGDPVWPWFRREVYVAREALVPVKGRDLYVIADFGRRPACLFAQEINNRVCVLEEMQGFNQGAVTFAPKVKRHLEQRYAGFNVIFRGDPKGADKTQNDDRTAYEVWAANGMPMQAAPVKQNLIQTRIEAVDHLGSTMYDGKPRLLIDPRCRTLIIAMEGRYCFEKKRAGDIETKTEPKKDRYSDLADCLQYLAVSLGEGRAMIGLQAMGEQRPVRVAPARRSLRRVM